MLFNLNKSGEEISLGNDQLMFYFCYGYIIRGKSKFGSSIQFLEAKYLKHPGIDNNNFDVRKFSTAPPKMLVF